MSDSISTNPTSLPIEFKAITISLFSGVGYNQSDVKEMTKNFLFILEKKNPEIFQNQFCLELKSQNIIIC